MRWIVRIVAVILVASGALAAAVYLMSNRRMATSYTVTPAPVTIPGDSASIARGRHLASAIGKCINCHGETLAGNSIAMGPVGTFTAPNLTSGKGGKAPKSDADWVRAIRHGVAADGRPLLFMPSLAYAAFTEADLAAVIAWVKSLPPVDSTLPPSTVGPIGRLIIARDPAKFIAAGALDHTAPFPAAVPEGPTAEYGDYLSVVGGCTMCHGANLKGGIHEGPPDVPNSADLTPAGPLASWSEADFRKALRDGLRPDGTAINPFMPWRLTREMTDVEIGAVWAYLRTK
jgi:cytochrome c553